MSHSLYGLMDCRRRGRLGSVAAVS